MGLFKDLFINLAVEGYKCAELQRRNGIKSGNYNVGMDDNPAYLKSYYDTHGELPHETQLRRFDAGAEERVKSFRKYLSD